MSLTSALSANPKPANPLAIVSAELRDFDRCKGAGALFDFDFPCFVGLRLWWRICGSGANLTRWTEGWKGFEDDVSNLIIILSN